MLTSNGASMDTCPLVIAYKLIKALTMPGSATEAIATVVRRIVATVRHALTCIWIRTISYAAQFNAMVIYC